MDTPDINASPNHKSISLSRIIILLFFAFIIVIISSITTYYYLSSKSIQPSEPVQNVLIPAIKPTLTITTNETEGWKTYTNVKDFMMFKYPPNWNLTIKKNTFTGYDEITVKLNSKINSEEIIEEFYVYPVKDSGKPQFTGKLLNTKKTIGNKNCKGLISKGTQQQPPNTYYECVVNGINYGISLISLKNDYSILNQILSTFKFLN